MPNVTYYVALKVEEVEGGDLVATDAVEARNADHARRLAARLAASAAGAVAFSRTADPDIGEYGDAVVLAAHGRLPEDVAALVAA